MRKRIIDEAKNNPLLLFEKRVESVKKEAKKMKDKRSGIAPNEEGSTK